MTDRSSPTPRAESSWAIIRSFSLRDWLDLSEASLTLAVAHVALRVASPVRVLARATTMRRTGASVTPAQRKRVAWLVGVAGRHVVPAPCLTRAVALARVLARRGIASEIRVGVRTLSGRLEAHAWVELDGCPINDDATTIGGYAPFAQPLNRLTDIQPRVRWH